MFLETQSVVVYHGEAEQAFDQFLWHGGGWKVVLTLALLALLAWAVRGAASAKRRGKP
jgi:hypothetical protein